MTWQSHVQPHGDLQPVAPRLWQVKGSLRDLPLPRNMAIYRMDDGGLWIHSAICLDEAGMARLEALGRPRILVVPNRFHRLDAPRWKERYPDLKVVCPRAARKWVEEVVPVDAEVEAGPLAPGIEAVYADGVKPLELAWLLDTGDGRALVVCDMLFNVREQLPGFKGFLMRHVTKSTGFFGLTRIARMALSVDAPRFRGWLEAMADRGDLRAVLMAHGDAVTEDVPARLREAAATV